MKFFLTALAFLIAFNTSAQSLPNLRHEDRIRILEAKKIDSLFGEEIWKGITKIPFTILLLADSGEYLIDHPRPSEDFQFVCYDSMLQSKIYYRNKSVYSKNFFATFPAINGVNSIVAGTPENTKYASGAWIITLLHEHFHLYVNSLPGYYESVEALGLSGGDKSGMWMLNYPFPYDSSLVEEKYNAYKSTLRKAVENIARPSFNSDYKEYKKNRRAFQQSLKSNDYKYFSFQLWQEGIVRYTEYKYLENMAKAGYQAAPEIMALADFKSFDVDKKLKDGLSELQGSSLKDWKRVCFYSVGFAEGLLLDKKNKDWRKLYLIRKFNIDSYQK